MVRYHTVSGQGGRTTVEERFTGRTDGLKGMFCPCLQKKPCLMLPILSGRLDIGFLYGFCSL